jgi:diaminopimelate decarboxylase
MLELFPDTAAIEGGALSIGGVAAEGLAEEQGTPLLVLCEQTLRAQARAYREAAPDALVVYGTKALPSVALLRLFAEEGLGADVSTLGELAFAQRAGLDGERLVVHGNNKSDEELAAAAEAGALVVVDALDEVERAVAAGVERALVRVTPGIEADTHEAIRTAHHGSKFGLPPNDAIDAVEALRAAGVTVRGLHVHIGSQLLHLRAASMTVEWLALFSARCRAQIGWTPELIDLGGGLGVRHVPEEEPPSIAEFIRELTSEIERSWSLEELPRPQLVLEPGRSLVSRAGVTLYRVGSVKRASESTTYVAVDGGMADNPRPAIYGARYTAVIANRADEPAAGAFTVAGRHCESGDVLIDRVELPEPRRGDLLAVPVTGGYTLAMASNYNASPRPAVVLVAGGEARVIRRRETVDDLLALEEG